jgi:iron(III) transport system ATP-binding protein
MSSDYLVDVQNLVARFGDESEKYELRIPSAQFNPRKLHLITGPNGSGKSTLLRILQGFQPINEGSITWSFDREPDITWGANSRAPGALFGHLGYMQQGSESLWPSRTTRQHVELAIRHRDVPLNSDSEKNYIVGVLNQAQIDSNKWDKRPFSRTVDGQTAVFSGGERQRVSFARAIASAPPVLLLDELEASLDEDVRARFVDWVIRDYLRQQNGTAFVVTHDPSGWLGGEWLNDERELWRLSREKRGPLNRLTIEHRPSPQPKNNSPQRVMVEASALRHRLAGLSIDTPPNLVAWERMGREVATGIHDFIDSLFADPCHVVTVLAKEGSGPINELKSPLLLGAAASPNWVPNGAEHNKVEPLLRNSGATNGARPAGSVPFRHLNGGLVGHLIESEPTDTYKGNRMDFVPFPGNVQGESFSFPLELMSDEARRARNYMELSKDTKLVYLFRVILRKHEGDARIVVGVDFTDTQPLDRYHRYFILEALSTALGRLA